MKRALFFLPFIFLLGSCDKIDNPIVKRDANPTDTTDTSGTVLVRNIFLEDFTGQDCPNCPQGTETIKTLELQYPNLISIAIHAGDFAVPKGEFTNDFRTYAGNSLLDHYDIGVFPSALINRKKYSGNYIWSTRSSWSTNVSKASTEKYILGIKPIVTFETSSRTALLSAEIRFREKYDTTVKICAMLIEDGVTGKQNKMGVIIEDYEFEHLFRGTIGEQEVWGRAAGSGPYVAGYNTSVSFSPYTVKPDFKEQNCSIVIFVFNEVSREVLQVEKKKLIP